MKACSLLSSAHCDILWVRTWLSKECRLILHDVATKFSLPYWLKSRVQSQRWHSACCHRFNEVFFDPGGYVTRQTAVDVSYCADKIPFLHKNPRRSMVTVCFNLSSKSEKTGCEFEQYETWWIAVLPGSTAFQFWIFLCGTEAAGVISWDHSILRKHTDLAAVKLEADTDW